MNIVAVTQSALAAGLLRHQVAAGNLANVSTPGAQPRRVDLRTAADGGVEATVRESEPAFTTYDAFGRDQRVPSGIDVAREVGELVESKHQVKLSAAVLRRATELQGSLVDVLA
jgi:flagellar basal body rod protein FlgB